jgi:hypothetical protein
MGEQVGGLESKWLDRGTLGEPIETWVNIAITMGLPCQSLL